MELTEIIKTYGASVALLWLLWRDLFPWLRDTFDTERKAQRDREQKERERAIALDEEERRARLAQEERFAKALDRFTEQMHTFSIAISTVAERLSNIERDQEYMRWAITVVSERLQVRPPDEWAPHYKQGDKDERTKQPH